MNLNQLRYALAVAKTGSFTKGAEECFVTQPTLSNGLAQLEEEFGEKVFIRTTRTVSLTLFGKHILPFIEKVVGAQAELVNESKNYSRQQPKIIRIGISPLVQTGRFADILDRFRKTYPDTDIIFSEQNMSDLYHILDAGQIDFIFGIASEENRPGTSQVFLYKEPLFFIPRSGAQANYKDKVSVDEIAGEIFVMVPDGCGLAKATRSLFRSKRKKLMEYAGKAMSYQVLEEWAFLGLGSALLPESKLQTSRSKAVPMVDENESGIFLIFEALWKKRQNAPYLTEFLNHIIL